jgi:ubiquitin C-terminal hydrolase
MKHHFNIYSNKGLTGLANLGNTCYLNSCLQTMSHTYEFNDIINNLNYKELELKTKNKEAFNILIQYKKLLDLMWSKNCTVSPRGFVYSIQQYSKQKHNSFFCNFSQNDLQEFLMFLFDAFHLGISTDNTNFKNCISNNDTEEKYFKMMDNNFKNDYSDIINLFYGASYSEISSIENNKILSVSFQPFFVLNLSMPNKKNITILDCLDLYLTSEELIDDNAWFNNETNSKENVSKRDIIWKLPKILIIHLKRWDLTGKKNQNIIQFDLEYDFSKYVNNTDNNDNNYELYSISNHQGNSNGGHYTTYVKNANNKWYEFNDTHIKEISNDLLISNKAYCLFYRKI